MIVIAHSMSILILEFVLIVMSQSMPDLSMIAQSMSILILEFVLSGMSQSMSDCDVTIYV